MTKHIDFAKRAFFREAAMLYSLGLENYEISYILDQRKKEQISRKWKK
jgi:hypothetical protein